LFVLNLITDFAFFKCLSIYSDRSFALVLIIFSIEFYRISNLELNIGDYIDNY